MRKLALHLAIACTTFAASTFLTNIWKALTLPEAPAETVQIPEVQQTVLVAEPELLEIFREYGPAQTRHDRAFFERVETDDFRLFTADGQALTRSEDIEAMNASPFDIVYQLEVQKIEVLGDIAVVSSTMSFTQGSSSVAWPSLDICVKRNGRWQIRSSTEFEQ
jgi:hypothetical protein